MKKLLLLTLVFGMFSCGSMEKDAQKVCDLGKEITAAGADKDKVEKLTAEAKELTDKYKDDEDAFEKAVREACNKNTDDKEPKTNKEAITKEPSLF